MHHYTPTHLFLHYGFFVTYSSFGVCHSGYWWILRSIVNICIHHFCARFSMSSLSFWHYRHRHCCDISYMEVETYVRWIKFSRIYRISFTLASFLEISISIWHRQYGKPFQGELGMVHKRWCKNQSFIFVCQPALKFEKDAFWILGGHNGTVEHIACTFFVNSAYNTAIYWYVYVL